MTFLHAFVDQIAFRWGLFNMKLFKAFLRTSYPIAVFTFMILMMHYFGARSTIATMGHLSDGSGYLP